MAFRHTPHTPYKPHTYPFKPFSPTQPHKHPDQPHQHPKPRLTSLEISYPIFTLYENLFAFKLNFYLLCCMRHQIIYADPPWPFNNKNTGGSMVSGASAKYSTMTLDEMKKIELNTDDNCILFMWWVGSQPKEALELVEAWGFTLKTMTGFVWVKKTKLWKMFFGMGFWTRAGSECCLIATKGKVSPASHSVRSVVEAVNEKHSKKPNIFADRIVELCGDLPRLELFARDMKVGWESFGDELPCNNEFY